MWDSFFDPKPENMEECGVTSRIISLEADREGLVKFISAQALPFTVDITKGKRRTVLQNKLQRLWCNEISEQLGDQTPEEIRGYCKLHFGVPIMRHGHEDFAEDYDLIIKPLPYEWKLKMMMDPLDFAVTRKMSSKEKTTYLDQINMHFSHEGLILTQPQE